LAGDAEFRRHVVEPYDPYSVYSDEFGWVWRECEDRCYIRNRHGIWVRFEDLPAGTRELLLDRNDQCLEFTFDDVGEKDFRQIL
jgi:hypothetical protein